MPEMEIDLLILVVVSKSQSRNLMANLNTEQFYFTIIDSNSSLFQEPTVCLLLGLNHTRFSIFDDLVNQYCQPYKRFIPVQMHATGELSHMPILETQEGGATLYGMAVEHFEQI